MATEVEINGTTYSIGNLVPYDQFHVLRRATPTVKAVWLVMRAPDGKSKIDLGIAALESLSSMPDEQLDYIRDKCLAVIKVKDGDRFFPLTVNGVLMYRTLDLMTMLRLIWEVLLENFQPFFKGHLAGLLKGEEAPPTT